MKPSRLIATAAAAVAVAIGGAACGNSTPNASLNDWGDCAMNVLAAHGVSPTVSNIPARLEPAVEAKCGTGPS